MRLGSSNHLRQSTIIIRFPIFLICFQSTNITAYIISVAQLFKSASSVTHPSLFLWIIIVKFHVLNAWLVMSSFVFSLQIQRPSCRLSRRCVRDASAVSLRIERQSRYCPPYDVLSSVMEPVRWRPYIGQRRQSYDHSVSIFRAFHLVRHQQINQTVVPSERTVCVNGIPWSIVNRACLPGSIEITPGKHNDD